MAEEFTEIEIRNSVGMADEDDEIEAACFRVNQYRLKRIGHLTDEDRRNFDVWLKNYKRNRHWGPVTNLPDGE